MPEFSATRRRWLDLTVLAAAMLACLLPFATKAYHIDDTLFVWAARHIAAHPLDFFGFPVHWYDTWMPMAEVTQNPPGCCYYLALVGAVCGWDELWLHLAMLLPTWGLVWGTYRLAEQFGVRPLPAALLTLFTPVVLICGTSVMCDVPMLCLWVWTVIVWDRGMRERRDGLLYLAAVLIAATTLTKYYGVCLIPLLAAYSLALDRPGWRQWARPFGVTGALLAGYQLAFFALYGLKGGLTGAMGYAVGAGTPSFGSKFFRLFEGLGFVGGCVGVGAVATAVVLPWRMRWAALGVAVVTTVVAVGLPTVTTLGPGFTSADSPFTPYADEAQRFPIRSEQFAQFLLWATAGAVVLLLAADELRARRDAESLLLFLWVYGTVVFAVYVNWSLNGRSVLPLAPAVAILLTRRLDGWGLWPVILVPAAALAVAVTWADARMADADKTAAARIVAAHRPPPGRTLWYQGHWGFQYYMQEAGARPWDYLAPAGRAGDLLVVPDNNYLVAAPADIVGRIGVVEVPACPWAATMNPEAGAGYYACTFDWRPLPFTFTAVKPQKVSIYRLTADQPPPELEP